MDYFQKAVTKLQTEDVLYLNVNQYKDRTKLNKIISRLLLDANMSQKSCGVFYLPVLSVKHDDVDDSSWTGLLYRNVSNHDPSEPHPSYKTTLYSLILLQLNVCVWIRFNNVSVFIHLMNNISEVDNS